MQNEYNHRRRKTVAVRTDLTPSLTTWATKVAQRAGGRSARTLVSVVERLESRALMSDASSALDAPPASDVTPPTTVPLAHPSITTTDPRPNATDVLRDSFISAEVFIPNGGIDPTTLQSQNV